MRQHSNLPVWLVLLVFTGLALPVRAADDADQASDSLLRLEASATAEVAADVGVVTLYAEKEGPSPADAQRQVNELLGMALRAGHKLLESRSGGYHTHPVYDRGQRLVGWRTRGEVMLKSKDFALLTDAIMPLTSRLQVGAVTFEVSRELRSSLEKRLIGEAISAFREKASLAAASFGFSKYLIRDITISSSSQAAPPHPMGAGMARSAMSEASAPLPLLPGTYPVTVTVSGVLEME